VSIANVMFDSNLGVAGAQQVDGDVLTIGASGNAVGASGLELQNVQGNLFFDDLDIFAGTAGLTVSGAGSGITFAVAPATSTISAANGTAVSVTNAALTLPLSSLSSTTSSGSGVSLTTVSGTFSAPTGSTITKTGGGSAAFAVNNSAAGTTVLTSTYGGTINNTSGTGGSVSITTADSGSSLSFTGAITDNPGTGIALATNTGATMTFSGGVTLNGANSRFAATGGGTLNVTGTNTIGATTAPTGPALNVASTSIGASGLTFQRISATGGTNGIVLSTTGSLGGLTVTGDAGGANNGSGGTIQNTTDHGISLSSTRDVSLDQMIIQNTANNGINGTTVTNFTFTNSTMTGAGDVTNEHGIFITDLFGTSAITGSSITGSFTKNLFVSNNNATAGTLTINNSTFSNTTDSDAVTIETNVSGNFTVNLTGNNNLNNTAGDGLQASANQNSTLRVTVDGSGSNYNGNLARRSISRPPAPRRFLHWCRISTASAPAPTV
jgi:hypothetical protein